MYFTDETPPETDPKTHETETKESYKFSDKDFILSDKIGQGNFSVVYKAWNIFA